MDRVIQDGMVAVLISPSFGAGFHTWNDIPNLCFCPYIVNHILNGTKNEIEESEIKKIYNLADDEWVSTIGLEDVVIEWLPQGTQFTIDEYDGSETILLLSDIAIIA